MQQEPAKRPVPLQEPDETTLEDVTVPENLDESTYPTSTDETTPVEIPPQLTQPPSDYEHGEKPSGTPSTSTERPKRNRKRPGYLKDYEL